MKRRFAIGLGIAALIGLAVFIVSELPSKELVYKGKTVRTWAGLAHSGDKNAAAVIKEMGTNAVPDLMRLLETKDPWYKRSYWSVQKKLPGSARARLSRKVGYPVAADRRAAGAQALGILGPEASPAIPAMSRLLHDPAHQTAYDTATAMSHMGRAAVQPLVEALHHTDANRRRAFVVALAEIGTNAQTAVPALVELLRDPDESVRSAAGYALTAIGPPGLQGLMDVIAHGKGAARDLAVRELLLYQRSPHTAIPALVEMAKDKDPAARLLAIQSLTAIRAMGHTVTATLTNALKDPAIEVRLAAITASTPVTWKREPSLPALIECLKDSSPQVREAAARALGEFGQRGSSAVPELTRVLEDKEPSVQAAAKEALGKIEAGNSQTLPSGKGSTSNKQP